MIKLGLIGLGSIAQHQIAAIDAVDGLKLTDAQDNNPDKAATLGKGVRFHPSLEQLINNASADLFLISTPSHTHFAIARTLIKHGKHCIIEKPLCSQPEELEVLLQQTDQHGSFVYAAFHAAFGAEVQWWLDNARHYPELGALTSFDSGFYDPYIQDGELLPAGTSLGGSWLDSGINALSVITRFIQPSQLRLQEARMTRCGDSAPVAQGSARFAFARQGNRQNSTAGFGHIDTNWTLGINRKTTRLNYEGGEILLQHSDESVYQRQGDSYYCLANLANNNPRLTNHYISMFTAVAKAFNKKQSNLTQAAILHRLLLAAAQQRFLSATQ